MGQLTMLLNHPRYRDRACAPLLRKCTDWLPKPLTSPHPITSRSLSKTSLLPNSSQKPPFHHLLPSTRLSLRSPNSKINSNPLTIITQKSLSSPESYHNAPKTNEGRVHRDGTHIKNPTPSNNPAIIIITHVVNKNLT